MKCSKSRTGAVEVVLVVIIIISIYLISSVYSFTSAQSIDSKNYFRSDSGFRSVSDNKVHNQVVSVLPVAEKDATASQFSTEESSSNSPAIDLYYIVSGDTRQSILKRYEHANLSWEDIAVFNGLSVTENPEPRSIIRIPAQGKRHFDHNLMSPPIPSKDPNSVLLATSISTESGQIQSSQASLLATNMGLAKVDSVASDTLIRRDGVPTGFGDEMVAMNVDMFVGEARVFGKVSIDRVAIGNGAILRSEVLASGELLTIAQAPGSSTLHLWHKDGSRSDFNIRVSEHDPEFRVKLEKSIRMRVKMIEFRRSALQRLGIDWGDSIDGPVFATAGDLISNSLFRPDSGALGGNLPLAVQPFTGYLGITAQLSSRINFLVNNGDAEMLAEPVLSCRNGGSAKFLAGGEIPYPTVGVNGQTNVEFREYGIRLEVSPVANGDGAIQASILTEVSSIDPSVTVLGAPGLLTRRTQTQVSVMEGDTIVIGGLLQSESSKDVDALPGVGKLPIVGKLFRSDNIRNNVSELVIFITPEIIDPSKPSLSRQQYDTNSYASRSLRNRADSLRKVWKQ